MGIHFCPVCRYVAGSRLRHTLSVIFFITFTYFSFCFFRFRQDFKESVCTYTRTKYLSGTICIRRQPQREHVLCGTARWWHRLLSRRFRWTSHVPTRRYDSCQTENILYVNNLCYFQPRNSFSVLPAGATDAVGPTNQGSTRMWPTLPNGFKRKFDPPWHEVKYSSLLP